MKRVELALLILLATLAFGSISQAESESPAISGRLEDGYRILTVPPMNEPLAFTVYRGDYIKFEIPEAAGDMLIVIPELDIERRLPHRLADAKHITMRRTGALKFMLNERRGSITVVDFERPNYRELSAAQAADMIARFQPLILDVRTPREFQSGHLPNAVLLPVQALQANIDRLAAYRGRDILVYCATGNRSTVASKILIDDGFKQIANLRNGIVDWNRRKFPVVQ